MEGDGSGRMAAVVGGNSVVAEVAVYCQRRWWLQRWQCGGYGGSLAATAAAAAAAWLRWRVAGGCGAAAVVSVDNVRQPAEVWCKSGRPKNS